MTHRSRPAALAALLTLILVAGCGSTGPSASPAATSASATPSESSAASAGPSTTASAASPAPSVAASCTDATATAAVSPSPISADSPAGATFTKIEGAVETLRGITATSQVPRYTLDQAGLCAYLRAQFAKQAPPEYLAATEKLYKFLGLLPLDASLEQLSLDLMTGQVIGLYDEPSKSMYVVSSSGEIGPLEQITYAHEFDHALQDQAFGISAIQGTALDQGDRTLARHALVEGDAVLLMSLWAQKNLSVSELGALAGASDPASQAALDAAPPILKEPLLWAYSAGLQLTLGAYQTSASFVGVDALWKNPPDTTEQLIHPDKLASREPAVPVAFPADFAKRLGAGWKVSAQDTLGELQLNILMRAGNAKAGTDPAAGWGGDRVALVEGPSGATAAVVDTTWDTAAAAGSAFDQLGQLVTKLLGEGKHATVLMPSEKRVVLVSADSDATLGAVANVMGLAQ